jgi:UPF0716 protein FxsA
MTRRRLLPLWLLVAVFVLVPLLEIWTILQVGRVVGPWWTIALLVLASVVGSWLMKREGSRAWRAIQEALATGRMPARELADGALVLIGGTLMLSPGFATDAVGILLVLPATRPVARRALTRVVERRLLVVGGPVAGQGSWGRDGPGTNGRRPGGPGDGPIVRGDVVD